MCWDPGSVWCFNTDWSAHTSQTNQTLWVKHAWAWYGWASVSVIRVSCASSWEFWCASLCGWASDGAGKAYGISQGLTGSLFCFRKDRADWEGRPKCANRSGSCRHKNRILGELGWERVGTFLALQTFCLCLCRYNDITMEILLSGYLLVFPFVASVFFLLQPQQKSTKEHTHTHTVLYISHIMFFLIECK